MIPFFQRKAVLISAVVLAAILSLGFILYVSGKPINENNSVKTESDMSITQVSPSAIESFSSKAAAPTAKPTFLIKNQDKAITELITKYYDALLNADKEAYDKITVDDDSIDIDVLLRKMEYIVGYDNQEIYVTQGTGNAVIVAYIAYDLKINSIKTPAPSIDQLLIKNVDGVPKLYFNELTLQEGKQIETIRNNEEVLALIEKVNQNFKAAIKSDTDLFDFYKSLEKRASKK
jgi:hypothetical protein